MLEIVNITTIEKELAIAWSDGEENYIPFNKLRHACPCANCQGEPDARGRVVKPDVIFGPKSFQLLRYEIVGGYAVKVTWGDGHKTGLFAYDLLRAL